MTLPTVFIDGDQGTTGLQIHERLRERTDLQLLTLPESERKDAKRRAEAVNACDVAILCLPDAAAREAVGFIRNPEVRVIDASSAHRTQPDWTYGFPEMAPGHEQRIREARRVTNPGCYPTGAIALLRPLIEAGLVPHDYPFAIHAVSGYSGGGRTMVDAFESGGASHPAPFQVYGLALEHKHTPEIALHAGLAHRPFFVPAYGAYRQGIVLTVPIELRQLPAGVDGERLHACLVHRYTAARHVHVMPLAAARAASHLDPQALNGTNDLGLGVFDNARHGQVLLSAVFDNLGKGASGAAVQNLDLMLSARA
ncbi:N-acetyl-gamma-glutamyl-phosphate reductase [Trinickia caryophylli]|uniref:N-acetyl-gamma-glutamyl-phosphate reductase n=1 Tax=Trinickia caryophylli TaxID=28094 RepID=A0A1X7F9Q9_TRICW|nr:N-acetyl-gamma-glutamyl-phosphate reductase [Trinickia caryophylli]PMS08817.1 N-acetyl-gamma-glutamyl-phosphate reductase [Trinickia caryophylli]TRX18965.1 N-acetyl-gamma-glutamyl-phosphate reductase [Trinickia caryophylli]WQE10236.1 N-acetyl-gamma-glutamyl-phosphate reductase [Trinickia caryophylli]SMF48271.1 N-acetyl-gamma-glutamyl-phosphate reductase [Trinickia caryophylli]GLU34321.1 N-acetyl-gamma-glutamyl-phosphate reductase 2 [Trinickia caryophylli]